MCAAQPSSPPWAAWSSGPSCLPGAPMEQCHFCCVACSVHHPIACAALLRYNTLGRLVQGQGAMVAVTKVAVDQLLFAPPFLALILSLCVSLSRHAVKTDMHAMAWGCILTPHRLTSPSNACRLTTAENGAGAVSAKLQQDWAKVVVTNWYLWVPFQFINFRFVPPKLTVRSWRGAIQPSGPKRLTPRAPACPLPQVAAVNTCAVVWNVILSLMSHAKVVAEPKPTAARGAKTGGKK
jgi:hypothetical protein